MTSPEAEPGAGLRLSGAWRWNGPCFLGLELGLLTQGVCRCWQWPLFLTQWPCFFTHAPLFSPLPPRPEVVPLPLVDWSGGTKPGSDEGPREQAFKAGTDTHSVPQQS